LIDALTTSDQSGCHLSGNCG